MRNGRGYYLRIKTNPDMAVKYINEAIILIKKFGDVIKKVNKEGI